MRLTTAMMLTKLERQENQITLKQANQTASRATDVDKLFARVAHALLIALAIAVLSTFVVAHAASDEADVRGAVESAFSQLKGGDYGALYDVLPSASQKKITRASFVRALERSRGMYALDRLEIGAVHVAGDLAVVDSTVYGRALAPFEGDGKIVLRQYLLREGGRWRVTTGDRSTVQPLLAANPAFARRYPLTQPRLYVKRDNRWVLLDELMKGARKRGRTT
jgi:hypothetical protein